MTHSHQWMSHFYLYGTRFQSLRRISWLTSYSITFLLAVWKKRGFYPLLAQHPEIKFVSVVGIDLAGNDTDEKIPYLYFMKTMMISLLAEPHRPMQVIGSAYEHCHTQ